MAEVTAAVWHDRLALILLVDVDGHGKTVRVPRASKGQAESADYLSYVIEVVEDTDDGIQTVTSMEFDPHIYIQGIVCDACWEVHNTVHPLGVPKVECPTCGHMIEVELE